MKGVRESVNKILEIGVLRGASLKMWRIYFPNATIVGLDCNTEQADKDIFTEGRIHLVKGEQGDRDFLLKIFKGQQFDFIIDDGSHRMTDQLMSFETLFPCVKPGGIYFIEDIFFCYHDDKNFGGSSPPVVWPNTVLMLKNQIDRMHVPGNILCDFYGNVRGAGRAKYGGDWTYLDDHIYGIHVYPGLVAFIKSQEE
jgi:predicted O-methyltransferase YrrM